jgi:hypothetical protein
MSLTETEIVTDTEQLEAMKPIFARLRERQEQRLAPRGKRGAEKTDDRVLRRFHKAFLVLAIVEVVLGLLFGLSVIALVRLFFVEHGSIAAKVLLGIWDVFLLIAIGVVLLVDRVGHTFHRKYEAERKRHLND